MAGATGYTGREVVRILAQTGVRTIAHVRPDSPRLDEWRDRFTRMGTVVDSTAWKLPDIDATLQREQPDIVFALLGTTRARARAAADARAPDASHETVDYGLTHMLIQAVRNAAPAARLVYLSSVGASTDSRSEYLRIRGRLEEELRESGLWWVAARPAIVSGPERDERRRSERIGALLGDLFLNAAAKLGARGMSERYRSISGERLARALIDVAMSGDGARVVDAAELQRRSTR